MTMSSLIQSISLWSAIILIAGLLSGSSRLSSIFAQAGVLKGFHKEVPSANDMVPVMEEFVTQQQQQRNLVTDEDHESFGPRGGVRDASPRIEPTEISFMILMDEFAYSNGATTISELSIGTKFAFSGRVSTKAEELGVASGSCTITSDIKKELAYCQIHHQVDTDNFGGFGTVMLSGSTDEVGGRLLVTGTGGTFESYSEGYAMVQFDPAGNPVIYVLLTMK